MRSCGERLCESTVVRTEWAITPTFALAEEAVPGSCWRNSKVSTHYSSNRSRRRLAGAKYPSLSAPPSQILTVSKGVPKNWFVPTYISIQLDGRAPRCYSTFGEIFVLPIVHALHSPAMSATIVHWTASPDSRQSTQRNEHAHHSSPADLRSFGRRSRSSIFHGFSGPFPEIPDSTSVLTCHSRWHPKRPRL